MSTLATLTGIPFVISVASSVIDAVTGDEPDDVKYKNSSNNDFGIVGDVLEDIAETAEAVFEAVSDVASVTNFYTDKSTPSEYRSGSIFNIKI